MQSKLRLMLELLFSKPNILLKGGRRAVSGQKIQTAAGGAAATYNICAVFSSSSCICMIATLLQSHLGCGHLN